MSEVKTTCPYCGVGCGVLATPTSIQGDPSHPANFGKLCSKGMALGETLDLEGRLLNATIRGKKATLTRALDEVANTFKRTIAEHGAGSVAFYVSGQLLTEDYYVANKLMKGFIGTGNIDTNSRLCMSSSVAGHKRAFGEDYVPVSYSDLEKADVVVLVGSNMAWCHPVLYQRLLKARETHDTKIVVIDPRKTMTARDADLFLPLKPDSDVALFTGLLKHIPLNYDYVIEQTIGVKTAVAQAPSLEVVAAQTELSQAQIKEFYALFAAHEKVITLYSQGVNQSASGTDKVNAIINAHLYTGRIGREGMGPFSITGQPNAMGGREVGGLANMLAAHIDFEDFEKVQRFWGSPTIAKEGGLKAVDMFKAVKSGQIKAIWIMATNPLHSMPDSEEIDFALENCPFVVVSEIMADTPLTAKATVMLPALGWGEKDGTVTNSERMISRQRAFLPAPQDAKPDWWLICQVAQRMGFEGFSYKSQAEIFNEHARLSAYQNTGERAFNLSAWIGKNYNEMQPKRWGEGFKFPKFKFIPTPLPVLPTGEFKLNTGRVRDQWHTMTRTGKSPRLAAHLAEPFCEMNAQDAARLEIAENDFVSLNGVILKAIVGDTMREGEIFASMHHFGVNKNVAAVTDPVSGQPALKQSFVTVKKFTPKHFAFAITRQKLNVKADYAVTTRLEAGYKTELASQTPFTLPSQYGEKLEFEDAKLGLSRQAYFVNNQLQAVYYEAKHAENLAKDFIASTLSRIFSNHERLQLLSGQAFGNLRDKGAIICACNTVGRNEIIEQWGNYAFAGTGCGSCKGEVYKLKEIGLLQLYILPT